MLTGTLRNEINQLWETFWTGGITNPLTVIEQITYLLFIKRLDEMQTRREREAHLLEMPLQKPLYPPGYEALRWSNFKNLGAPEKMYELFTLGIEVNHTRLSVFDFMKNLAASDSPFARFMKGATFMIPTPRLLDQAVQKLDAIKMDDRDTKGDLYEYLLSKIAQAGTNGQFRTPRHIIRLMVDMVEPKPTDKICDPAAGTAGFLVTAFEYLYERHKNDPAFYTLLDNELFTGIEFDASMMRIAAMNLLLHGVEQPTLLPVDALSGDNPLHEQFSLILANPPFKGSLADDTVEPSLKRLTDTKKTELLFLALLLRMLRTGGRAAVIVPDGVLFGSSRAHRAIREIIVEQHHLQAVVSMPGGVFKPYAGVSTAILFFTKTNSGGDGQVWFYDMHADGFSLDDKRQKLDHDGDLPDILARWQNRAAEADRPRTAQSFFVPLADIRANDYDLSINRYKEIVYEPTAYAAPAEILAQIRQLDTERQALMMELERMLHA
jgi:type I restriction enzyme M protein